MEDIKEFYYNGRTILSGPDPTGKNTLFGYKASESELNRIESKYGEQYINRNNSVVLIGGYVNNEKNNVQYFPPSNDTAILGGISNYDLTIKTANDPNFYRTATGEATPNTAPTSPDQPSPDGGSSTPITQPNETKPGNAKGYLIYPLQMRRDQDRIMFQAYEYQSGDRLKIGDSGAFGELGAVKYVNRKEPVLLSIQSSISDQNSVGWEPDTLNPIEVTAAELSKEAMNTKTPGDLVDTVTKKLGRAYEQAKYAGKEVQTYLIGQAIGVNNLQSRLLGQVLNPNLELLFQGPQLRPFNFTFKMSARDLGEAKEIKDIIRYFKKNMAVKKGSDVVFLKAPNVFKIQYQYGNGNPHKSLNLIKMCALTNFSVDYTPLGSYMTYDDEDKTMVAYTMSLQFQELTPIYDSDYEEFSYGEEKGKPIKVPLENSIGP